MSRKKRSRKLAPTRKASEIIDGRMVFFTNHAIERFVERTRGHIPPLDIGNNPEERARELLADSEEDRSLGDVERVKRLIGNDFVDVLYLSNTNLRFVITPRRNVLLVLTVETIDKRRPLIPPR